MSEGVLPRMRIRKGRVMHAVTRHTAGGMDYYESVCRAKTPVKGVSSTYPRAQGPADWWSEQRWWHSDCQHCPPAPILAPGAYLIWSNHHGAWWGPNGSGYRSTIAYAGRYDYADTAQWLGRGCGCCKVPEVLVPTPAPELLNDPEALMEYARTAPAKFTRLAIKHGGTSRWYSGAPR